MRVELGATPHWWRGRNGPRLRQALALVVAVAAVASGLRANAAADRVRRTYGAVRHVAVARHPLEPGDVIRPDDLRWVDLPALAVPEAPVAGDPVGRTVAQPVGRGEVLTDGRVAGSGHGLGAAAGPGRRAVSVPLADSALRLEPGDHVDLLAAGATVARDAPVLALADGHAVLGISVDELGAVAGALAAGTPIVALVG
jgi:Flp pilus assembly protein CpaB